MGGAGGVIKGLPARVYPQFRDEVLPFFEEWAKRDVDGATVADYEKRVLASEAQLYVVNQFQALCMTHLTKRTVRITHCSGVRRHEWQEELDRVVQEWARALGKKRVIATVRPGWAKFGKLRGYKEVHREMAIEV